MTGLEAKRWLDSLMKVIDEQLSELSPADIVFLLGQLAWTFHQRFDQVAKQQETIDKLKG